MAESTFSREYSAPPPSSRGRQLSTQQFRLSLMSDEVRPPSIRAQSTRSNTIRLNTSHHVGHINPDFLPRKEPRIATGYRRVASNPVLTRQALPATTPKERLNSLAMPLVSEFAARFCTTIQSVNNFRRRRFSAAEHYLTGADTEIQMRDGINIEMRLESKRPDKMTLEKVLIDRACAEIASAKAMDENDVNGQNDAFNAFLTEKFSCRYGPRMFGQVGLVDEYNEGHPDPRPSRRPADEKDEAPVGFSDSSIIDSECMRQARALDTVSSIQTLRRTHLGTVRSLTEALPQVETENGTYYAAIAAAASASKIPRGRAESAAASGKSGTLTQIRNVSRTILPKYADRIPIELYEDVVRKRMGAQNDPANVRELATIAQKAIGAMVVPASLRSVSCPGPKKFKFAKEVEEEMRRQTEIQHVTIARDSEQIRLCPPQPPNAAPSARQRMRTSRHPQRPGDPGTGDDYSEPRYDMNGRRVVRPSTADSDASATDPKPAEPSLAPAVPSGVEIFINRRRSARHKDTSLVLQNVTHGELSAHFVRSAISAAEANHTRDMQGFLAENKMHN